MNTKYPDTTTYTLFSDGTAASVSASDVLQGALGNCWLESSIASAASDPSGRLFKMFNQKTRNSAGIYSINLYSMGVPVTVVVDDKIAFNSFGP